MDIKTFIQTFTAAVSAYLCRQDPFGIGHEEVDEYDLEARVLVARIVDPGVDRPDLAFVIKDTFRRLFAAEESDERYALYAADIWALYDVLHAEHKIILPAVDDLGNPTNV